MSIDPKILRRPAVASSVVAVVLVLSDVLLDRPAYATPDRAVEGSSTVDTSR